MDDGKYIYEGWNLIAEYKLSGATLIRKTAHYPRTDICDSVEGAGGVGGFVVTKLEVGVSGNYYTGYDSNEIVIDRFSSSGGNIVH